MNKTDFLRALPEPLRADPQAAALAQVAAQALDQCAQEIETALIYSHIENLPEELLDILAYDFKIDWYDSQYTLEEKRRTVRDSWRVRRFLGTKYAVQTALSAIYPGAEVQEWFEYDGEPYHFRVHVNVLDTEFHPSKHKRVLERVQWYKNLRSWLDSVHYDLQPIVFSEQPGKLFFRDLRFQTFFNYWNCYSFDGRRQFDGSLLFNQRRGGLSLARTHIKTSAVMPHRVYPSKISAGVLAFRTDEKVFAILDGGRTVFDNMGEFIRLNGQNDLNGSWLLWQRARSPIYKDFQITETVREKKKFFIVSTIIRAVQHTPIFFQKAKLKTSVFPFAPTKESLVSRTIFLSKVKESISSDICKIFFSGFSTKNGESVSIIEKYFHRFQEKKDFLSRRLSISMPLSESTESGNAELFAGIFEVLNVTETLDFYQNWRVINRNLSSVLSPVSVETNEKISNDTAIQNIKNVTFSPYSICNNSTFNVKVAITTVRPSRADGTYRLDGTLRFDGKALPQTETL